MINIFRKVFAGLCLLFLFLSASAQPDSVDVFINQQMLRRKIPGLQLAIIKDGKIIKKGNYGLANVQDSIPVTDKTVFSINSITKAFTGVAILQLMEGGKLQLSAPISTYLGNLPRAWMNVTVQQLLSHTSGIPDMVDEEESLLIAATVEGAWEKVISSPMIFSPGEAFRYNQTNYLLLGKIIDTLSGMPFTEFIINGQLEKAGMTKTIRSGFGASKNIVPHSAGAYRYSRGTLVNMFFSFPPSLQTAAGMSSTAEEIALWLIQLQAGNLFKNPTSLRKLWQPALLNNGKTAGFNNLLNGYAAGWPVITRAEHPAMAPVGGGRSALFVYPNDGLSIVVLTNLAGGAPDVFIDELAGLFIPDMKEVNGFGLSPNLKLLRSELEKNGYGSAEKVARQMQKKSKAEFSEKELNNWAYKLIKQGKAEQALEIFKLNVALFPQSSNAFDSLGEMYVSREQYSLAIKNYEMALKLNPANENAREMLKKLQQGN